jgi:hypothetical protein
MNCDNCQNLLSEFVDSESALSAEVEAHLEVCEGCAGVYRDFSALSQFCSVYQEEEVAPPNSQALWCRISNIIESEDQPAVAAPAEAEKKKGILAGVWQKSWQLSFSQAITAVMGVAIISSLLTIVGIKSSFSPTNNSAANSNTQPSLFDTLLSRAGITPAPEALREKTFNEKQAVIDYWNSRVKTRREQWTARVRDTFDRNLREIDQVVFEYSQTLKENPQDSLTEEMLNSAMNEKMDLLREFSEL